jgi:acyl-CoA hydrolase
MRRSRLPQLEPRCFAAKICRLLKNMYKTGKRTFPIHIFKIDAQNTTRTFPIHIFKIDAQNMTRTFPIHIFKIDAQNMTRTFPIHIFKIDGGF